MYIVLLTFAKHKQRAAELMQGHNDWIAQGFDDSVFLLVGSLADGQGGSVMAHNTDRASLEERVNADPFVAAGVVEAEIIEISPKKTDARLEFLVA
ncbi:MAG: YciI family protein [Granulosicoccaceae bacterium]|jgi:uncharacterized protein YciI